MNLRTAAGHVIASVLAGKSLSDALPTLQAEFKDARDQAWLQAVCYGICRRYFYLAGIINLLLEKQLKTKDQDVYALLLVGLYQLTDMRIPAHAAVSETVAAVNDLRKTWAKSLVNAVLRNFQRREETLATELDPIFKFSHPDWFIGKIKKAWPSQWEAILNANNQHPPFSIRVNQKIITRADYLNKLRLKNVDAEIIPETSSGLVITKAVDVNELPGFQAGEVSVQDGAAQLAAELLEVQEDHRVLDACAAPGGKTAHILELQPKLATLIAIDKSQERLQAVEANLQRLHLKAECIAADAADSKSWWNQQLFDRILIDTPCSATGVIRRHPDIKLLRRPEDIAELALEQKRILEALWPLLKVGGLLVYATCSIFPQENSNIVEAFLQAHRDAIEEKISAAWGINCTVGKQILPGMHGMDGFYYARLRKCSQA